MKEKLFVINRPKKIFWSHLETVAPLMDFFTIFGSKTKPYYSGIFLFLSVHKKFSVIPFILRGGGFILGNQYKLYRMTPLSYHGYSVSGSSNQQCDGIPLKLLCLFSAILVHHKDFSRQSVIQVPHQ